MDLMNRINRIVTVEPTVLIYFLTFSMGLVAWQQTLYLKLCHHQHYNTSACLNSSWEAVHPSLQKTSSQWIMYTNIATLPPLVVCITMLSGYSDQHGVRLALTLPLLGGILTAVWTILQIVYLDWDVSLLLIACIGWGVSGYYPTIVMAATTYLIRDPDVINLVLRIAVLEALQAMASALGTLIVGPIMDVTDGTEGLIAVWVVMAVFLFFALADVTFRLKRLPTPDHHSGIADDSGKCSSLRACFNLRTVKFYFKSVFRKRDNSKRLHLHIVIVATMIGFLSFAGVTNTIFLYLTKEYGKSTTEYSIYNGVGSIATFLGNTLLVYILTTYYPVSDIAFTVMGAVGSTISFALLSYADHAVPYWLAVVFRLFLSHSFIGGRLYIAHTVDEAEQAACMGYYATVQAVVGLLASVVFNSIYPATLTLWPGLCFAIEALLYILTVPALTFVRWNDIRQGSD